jgi:hypothetical protein
MTQMGQIEHRDAGARPRNGRLIVGNSTEGKHSLSRLKIDQVWRRVDVLTVSAAIKLSSPSIQRLAVLVPG